MGEGFGGRRCFGAGGGSCGGWHAWRGVNLWSEEKVAWEEIGGDVGLYGDLGLVSCRWF